MIGKLTWGNLRDRQRVLELLLSLLAVSLASDAEVLLLIERDRLIGRGIGYVDAHLLASTRLSYCRQWAQDRRMGAVTQELELRVAAAEDG